MTRILAVGIALLVLLEVLLVTGPAREWLLPASAVLVALAVLALRIRIGPATENSEHLGTDDGPDAALGRWRDRTRLQLGWADGSRGDWDRHLRPMLAKDFQLGLGRRFDTPGSGAGSLDAAGRMMFGDELWHWVNPSDIAITDRDEPGPGRAVLADILTRLERM